MIKFNNSPLHSLTFISRTQNIVEFIEIFHRFLLMLLTFIKGFKIYLIKYNCNGNLKQQ